MSTILTISPLNFVTWLLIVIFTISAVFAFLGITSKIDIKPIYLRALFFEVIIGTVVAVIWFFKENSGEYLKPRILPDENWIAVDVADGRILNDVRLKTGEQTRPIGKTYNEQTAAKLSSNPYILVEKGREYKLMTPDSAQVLGELKNFHSPSPKQELKIKRTEIRYVKFVQTTSGRWVISSKSKNNFINYPVEVKVSNTARGTNYQLIDKSVEPPAVFYSLLDDKEIIDKHEDEDPYNPDLRKQNTREIGEKIIVTTWINDAILNESPASIIFISTLQEFE